MGNKQCEKCEHSISNGWCKYPTCIKEPFSEDEEKDYQEWLKQQEVKE